jgi:hypothetical protein
LHVDVHPEFKNGQKVAHSTDELRRVRFPELVAKFVTAKEEFESLKPVDVDLLVIALRYHILALKQGPSPLLERLADAAWGFLDALGDPDAESTFVLDRSIALILADIIAKLPAGYYEGVDRGEPFPGRCGELEVADFAVVAKFRSPCWFSTGLYLRPGLIAHVTVDSDETECMIQVGAHASNVIHPAGRFPAVTTAFPIAAHEIQIGSPFGGILYVTVANVEEPITLNVTVRGVARHPLFTVGDPTSWNETKDMATPWGEIVMKSVVFTVPQPSFAKIPNLNAKCQQLEGLIGAALHFVADTASCQYRVIFDVEVNDEDMADDYPIYLPLRLFDGIFCANEPGIDLFTLIRLIAERALTPSFPSKARGAIAHVAAYVALHEKWPSHPGLEGMGHSALVTCFLHIHSAGKNFIPQALAVVRAKEAAPEGRPANLFDAFLQKLHGMTDSTCAKDLQRAAALAAASHRTFSATAEASADLEEFRVTIDSLEPPLPRT